MEKKKEWGVRKMSAGAIKCLIEKKENAKESEKMDNSERVSYFSGGGGWWWGFSISFIL